MYCDVVCVPRQVGEIEEQLAAARREVTKSEEANQKLQRDVKEVCCVSLFLGKAFQWARPDTPCYTNSTEHTQG